MLSGCEETRNGPASDGPPSPGVVLYETARAAAEAGNYLEAIQAYDKVLRAYPKGRDGAEVRLEFAKVLLFADDYSRALLVTQSAMKLSRARDIRGRGTILSAIAEHGRIEEYLGGHPPYIEARDRARRIYAIMVDAYERHIDYDEIGIIPARIALLRESLAKLELREMNAELARGDKLTASQRAQYIQIEFGDTDVVAQHRRQLQRATVVRI